MTSGRVIVVKIGDVKFFNNGAIMLHDWVVKYDDVNMTCDHAITAGVIGYLYDEAGVGSPSHCVDPAAELAAYALMRRVIIAAIATSKGS